MLGIEPGLLIPALQKVKVIVGYQLVLGPAWSIGHSYQRERRKEREGNKRNPFKLQGSPEFCFRASQVMLCLSSAPQPTLEKN